MPQKKGDWLSQFEDVQAKPLAPAPAERQAAPPAEDWLSQFDDVPQQPTYGAENEKDVYGNAVVRDPNEYPHLKVARGVGTVLGEIHNLNPAKLNESIQQAFWHPIDTIKGVLSSQDAIRQKAQAAFQAGDYLTGARHFTEWMVPIAAGLAGGAAGIPGGPVGMAAGAAGGYAAGAGLSSRLSESGNLAQEGEYLRSLGAALDVGAGIAGPALAARGAGQVSAGFRGARPVNPAEAAAVEFAIQEGIPLDAATATGNRFVRGAQRLADESAIGSVVSSRARQAQQTALRTTGERLAAEANTGGPVVDAVGAGEGVARRLEGGIREQNTRANAAYERFRQFEEAAPEEFVEGRQPAAAKVPVEQVERNFLVRWLADDLRDAAFQQGGSTQASRRIAYEEATAADPSGKHGFVTNEHVAGTPVQRMLDAAGVKGTRPQQALTLENYLSGRTQSKTNARLDAIADVMREAWDGQRFDWELVSDEALSRTGASRRDLQAPSTWNPEMLADPGASRFFPSEAVEGVKARPVVEAQKLATDITPTQDAMRPVLEKLQQDNAIVPLMGSRAEALRVLTRFVDGPKNVPLSVAERALGELKSIARSDDIPELRTEGQGIAAQAVKSLSEQIRQRAAAAGPEVLAALEEGRAATRTKYDIAGVREFVAGSQEPRAVFSRLTAGKDAGIAKLRELRRVAPEQMGDIGRALLEDILERPTAEGGFQFADKAAADWGKIGAETRKLLFPKPGHAHALDQFFTLAKKMNENPNPSGSALTAWKGGEIAGWFASPLVGVPYSAAMGVMSKVLHSPKAIQLMTRGMRMSVNAAPAAQTAAAAQFANALREAGVHLERLAPAAAEGESPQGRRP